MKTLDEVIEAQERCSKYPDCHFCYLHSGPICGWIRDALHYLKEYRAEKANLEIIKGNYQDAVANCEKAENKFKSRLKALNIGTLNEPLTWEELKGMEGKPVWMEDDTGTKFYRGWAIVLEFIFDGAYLRYVCDDYSETCVVEADLGRTWQAYRKER